MSWRCRALGHTWQFGVMPNQPVVVSLVCKRCGKVEVKPAEPIDQQLTRLDDNAKLKPLFTRRGWPK
jgi:hypothetical protein